MTSADVIRHGRGGVDQTPVDSGLAGTNAHAREMREIEADLGVAAPLVKGHRRSGSDDARRRRSAADTGIGDRGCNRRHEEGQTEEELTGNLVDKEMWPEEARRRWNRARRRRVAFGAAAAFSSFRLSQLERDPLERTGERGRPPGQGVGARKDVGRRRFEGNGGGRMS